MPSQRTKEDSSLTRNAHASDQREQTTPDRRPPAVSGAQTLAFVLALVIVVVLVALL